MAEWGNRLKLLRESKHLTQQEVADKSGLQTSHLSRMESGDYQSIKHDTLIALARAFDITPSQLSSYLYKGDTTPDFPEINRLPSPLRVPVYTDFPFHAGSPTQPVEYIHRAQFKQSPKHIEGYVVHGNCLDPVVQDNDIIIVDRDGEINNGDIIACLMDGELHIARLRRVAGELWLENNNRKYKFEECQVAAPVIEVIRRLK